MQISNWCDRKFSMSKREIKRVSLNYSVIKQATKYHYGHDIV